MELFTAGQTLGEAKNAENGWSACPMSSDPHSPQRVRSPSSCARQKR